MLIVGAAAVTLVLTALIVNKPARLGEPSQRPDRRAAWPHATVLFVGNVLLVDTTSAPLGLVGAALCLAGLIGLVRVRRG